MVFVCPHDFGCRNACARSAPLANPLTRSGVSRTIIRPQTLAIGRPPFRYVRAFRLRVPGAAQPGGRNVLRPSRHGSCRARNRVVETGLRPRRPQTPGPAAPVPLRLHSRTPLHSRRPTASACSPVRLLTSSTNQFQRCETAALDSAPAEPGAHRVPPTRPASTIWAHRSPTRYGPPHAPEGFDARGDNAPRPTNDSGSFASSLTAHNRTRAKNAGDLREPRHPQCQARRGRRRQARDGVPRVTSDVVSSRPRPTSRADLAQRLRGFRV